VIVQNAKETTKTLLMSRSSFPEFCHERAAAVSSGPFISGSFAYLVIVEQQSTRELMFAIACAPAVWVASSP
jgi:hypothetical protein